MVYISIFAVFKSHYEPWKKYRTGQIFTFGSFFVIYLFCHILYRLKLTTYWTYLNIWYRWAKKISDFFSRSDRIYFIKERLVIQESVLTLIKITEKLFIRTYLFNNGRHTNYQPWRTSTLQGIAFQWFIVLLFHSFSILFSPSFINVYNFCIETSYNKRSFLNQQVEAAQINISVWSQLLPKFIYRQAIQWKSLFFVWSCAITCICRYIKTIDF